MLIKFRNHTFLEKPMGSKLVGLKRDGVRPTSVELDRFDLTQLLQCPDIKRYITHLMLALDRIKGEE